MMTRATLLVLLASSLATLSACKKDGSSGDPGGVSMIPGAVPVTAGEDGFKPSSVTFAKGSAGKLVFTRTTDDTCATEVVFPELDIKKELPKGKPVTVDIPTDKAQKLTFQCGMGMYKSSVVISAN
jgi:hypothetical protein